MTQRNQENFLGVAKKRFSWVFWKPEFFNFKEKRKDFLGLLEGARELGVSGGSNKRVKSLTHPTQHPPVTVGIKSAKAHCKSEIVQSVENVLRYTM